jgi:transmembrane sensor
MSKEPSTPDPSEPSNVEVARWLARRDRGLTGAEQDEYLQWLREDPRRAHALADLDRVWKRLDTLSDWRPQHADQPNPDLLAPAAARWRRFVKPAEYAMAAAAAITVGVLLFYSPGAKPTVATPSARATVKVLPGPERLALVDGSVVELNEGGRIQTAFTTAERRVRLLQGEASFIVAKDAARPFLVDAGTVAVRAVGTVFDVRRSADVIEVLVTEGKVRLERPAVQGRGADVTALAAGQRATIELSDPTRAPAVSLISAAARQQALAWQGVRFEFSDLPLAEVVTEFNLRNQRQIVVADAATGSLKLGGTFRADNVDGFVRLLEASLGVTAGTRADGTIVLRHAP